ncbi:probable quinone oxidoreductase [Oryza brachyantha]|uniref:Enoyl reductase (ER) domain-containing protein n=1 Tax=Oryza brachyantha TaxID=4533 RepID=J3MY64_ORYBR|nr:probable quinone oxidoreductase [Oryza brachyantha]
MELRPGMSALVTGGASGIGKALCIALAQKGLFVTIVDFSEENGREAASLVQIENKRFHGDLKVPTAIFIKCDVSNAGDLSAAFGKHVDTYGGLDICINCAGIAVKTLVYDDQSDGTRTWRHAVNVNLVAVIDGTRIASQIMRSGKKPGVIINIGSAAGLYPMNFDPIYSGTKAGVVMFTRSLAPLRRHGVRVNVLCPEFVQTNMAEQLNRRIVDATGGYITMEDIVNATFELIKDESKAGACLWITKRRGMEYWPTPEERRKYLLNPSKSKRMLTQNTFSTVHTPEFYEKIVVHTLSHNFRDATRLDRVRLRLPVEPHSALVKIIYAGVNASDVNFSSGRYFSGGAKEIAARLPFDAGFEAVGIVASVGDSVNYIKVGTPVALMTYGTYSEFIQVPAKRLLPVPRPEPEVVAMLTSGLTASISLEKAGQMKSGEVVLVTAAAGGTGQFAVQLAKLAGNKVVATCGGNSKAALLASLGVDRVINYQNENIKDVLKKEFPRGADIIYESVGGEMFDLCLNALAVHGRLIVIGMISQYQGEHGWRPRNYTGLCDKILAKSQTVAGFFLIQCAQLWQDHLDKLFDLYASGKLKVSLDPKKFLGVASAPDAVEYLHSGKSVGKVVVCIDPSYSQTLAKL